MAITVADWEHWDKFLLWFERKRLVGDIKGNLYYIKEDDFDELFGLVFGELPPSRWRLSEDTKEEAD